MFSLCFSGSDISIFNLAYTLTIENLEVPFKVLIQAHLKRDWIYGYTVAKLSWPIELDKFPPLPLTLL